MLAFQLGAVKKKLEKTGEVAAKTLKCVLSWSLSGAF
jgi:hypothetical protein